MAEFITARQAAGLIEPEDSVLIGGSGGGHAVPEAVIEALAARYLETGAPRDLSLISVVSIGDWQETGFNILAEPGLAKRVVSGGFNNCPRFAALAFANEIEAYTLPQGVLSQLCRDMAAGRPGLVTTTGLHTFVDPRHGGGRQSERATEDLVELITLKGEDYLFYRSLPVDVAVIRGTSADEQGNISMEEEAFFGEMFSMAAAAHLHGGIVIAQVKQVVQAGTLPGKEVKVPGAVVDFVVVEPDQRQTYQTRHSTAYAGAARLPDTSIATIPFDVRKVIARRAAMELFPGAVVNLGFGVSNGISAIAAEEGFYRELTLTVEQGIIGGVPAVGKDAGAGINYDMMADQPYQFDFYDGGGLDIAFLSFAEVDGAGNVNVSRYGRSINGPGGFINISQGARKVVFSGTLTTGGLDVVPDGEGGLTLRQEGRTRKWLDQVGQVTFNGRFARERGQEVLFVTERAVFRLTDQGIRLEEIAGGIDLQRDVLAQIGFPVLVADDLRHMDPRLFREEPMALLTSFRQRQRRHASRSVASEKGRSHA
ncbi:acyl CoA:acetate/3-ketoacid CoA transferase [Marinivivus vitaminiproducens]|uniref:acyl CoA:acetate/3-ketoacid CoA transferase n=1 Tax=Marinivivus vitaminiproducens TaxID=3035935 RepID=UPI0027A7A4A8|nr:malonate decarboxylase subunit alpha [Geminicoccaceae bacterium SCSIO 64248]